MAAFCIDHNSPLFKETAKRLGVSEFELEQIAYKYGNQEGTFGQFPSDEVIKADLDGVPNYNASEAQAKLWNLRYASPREFNTVEELNEAKQDALQYFGEESVRTFLNSDGKYELRVGEQKESVYQQNLIQTINIWSSTNENADLSNFATRPFEYDGRKYNSVEQAFQLAKLRYAAPLTQQPVEVQAAVNNPNLSSYIANKIGKKIVGLDRAKWDSVKYGLIKELMKASFQQNPQALQRLLDTGDATLTHNQAGVEWREAFPRILMEIRNELRGNQPVQTNKPTQISQTPFASQAEFYSGAAVGSDTAWATEARKRGINVREYKTADYDALSDKEKVQIEKEYIEARNFLGKPVLRGNTEAGKLTRRDMMQADSADAIFAVGKITPAGGKEMSGGKEYTNRSGHDNVAGGTANAVARGILRGIPVYVYDREAKEWKMWDASSASFVATEEPTLTPHAAVIGTRGDVVGQVNGKDVYDISDEEKGIIRNLIEKSISQPIPAQQVAETPVQVEQAPQEPMWAPPKVERDFHEREVTVVTKMDNLVKSGTITVTEITDEANKVMDWISDQLTQYLEDPSIVWNKFVKNDPSNTMTEEETIAKVSKMSRKDLVDFIGVDTIISTYANEIISPTKENSEIFGALKRAERSKYKFIKENIEGLVQYGYSRFLAREGFGFQLSDVAGQTYTTTEEVSVEDRENIEDYNNPDTVDNNVAEYGNQQEHWMIESATRDVMDNASVKVKQAIADCFILQNNGKLNEDGSIKYDIAKDSLNRNERVVPINAVRSIVRWTQGAITLSQMIDKLSAKVNANPWISQIVTRLQDTSGKEADFQSQFFNTFCKHFQTYSVVKMNPDGSYYTMEVNVHPALKSALENISIQQKMGGWALVNENGTINADARDTLEALSNALLGETSITEDNRDMIVSVIFDALEAVGMPQARETIDQILTDGLKNTVQTALQNISDILKKAIDANVQNYNPFEFGGDYAVRGYVSNLIKPFTDLLEDTMVSSVFDSGKMYQSNITPSWTTKLFQKMHLPEREFREFIINEFFSTEWFIDDNEMFDDFDRQGIENLSKEELNAKILDHKIQYITDHPDKIRNTWLKMLWDMTESQRQDMFQHKVQLNFNKENYMRGMDDLTYVMSVYTEYYADSKIKEKGNYYANFRFPMLSNKPSNEFVKFIRYTDIGDRTRLGRGATKMLRGYYEIFLQEVGRIQTVEMRNLKEGDEGYIANFDANEGKGSGLRFTFLDYLNEYLNGTRKDTELGRLLDRKLHAEDATEALTREDEDRLEELVKQEVANHLNDLADRLIAQYKENGLFEALKKIEGVGKTDFDVTMAIREFAWNDNFAQANLLQLLVTDKAFYKNEEDLQKRLAQVHSPGIRGNWEATDFGDEELGIAPRRISDGKLRVVKLADFSGDAVVQNIIENLEVVFDQRIAEVPEDQKQAMRDLKDNILDAYRKINVVDGQAFVSPTAYRKKALAFGEWSKEDEEVYKDLMQDRFNMAKVQKVFNPRKPFTYGKTTKRLNMEQNTPIKQLRYGVQYKDSEYLLIMADALIRGRETGKPNLLGAIFDVMEESYKSDPTIGIDFVVFESGVKTGLQGAISINEFVDNPDGQALARQKIMDAIYVDGKVGSPYNENFVDVLDAEDYTTQQTVPEHFMHGSLQWGSQIRALMTSDLETSYNGEPVLYEYLDPATGELQQKTAEEIRQLWEENTANMIHESIGTLREELGLVDGMSIADSNVLISKILQREILSNPRYGVDLLLACSVDAEGNFRIPLGDPIQSKRVEQLLNSIVKNRINKQKVAGGTLVEVTNFGTSKRLNIRFKDKNDATGNTLLDTKEEYLAKGHTEEEFKQYVKDNQGGIAYYECYAPAWTRDLFLKFADEKGNIDVEAINMLDPDLLKMYGYRIPTEDKYSTAPYKIVGFLPQEAGDGFMQPWETTVIDGSDFDVDKKNLMRMALNLKSKLLTKKEFFNQEGLTEETEENLNKFRQYRRKAVSAKTILDKIGDGGDITLSEKEIKAEEWYEKSRYKRDKKALKEELVARNEQAEESFDRRYKEWELDKLDEAIKDLESREDLTGAQEEKLEEYKKDYDKKWERLTKSVDSIRANNERWYKEAVEERRKRLPGDIEKSINAAKRRRKVGIVRNILAEGVFRDSSTIPANQRKIFLAVKKAYLETLFEVEKPKPNTKDYYNNLMFNMQWAIATHPSTSDKMLNPGSFDMQKRSGYMAEAYRLGYDWDKLEKMDIDGLKKLVMQSKNLMDFDVQTQFYKQNAVAGQILGIFAVAKSAHAMFEGRNYGILVNNEFYIDGMKFSGVMAYDQKYDRTGTTLIGKTLGSLVGASADAVKDPVLNLMNINKETVNVLNTALRLGLDFQTAALLLSSSAVSRILDNYRKNSLISKTSFDKEVRKAIRELEKKDYIGKDSPLKVQNLTREEMIQSIRRPLQGASKEEIQRHNQIAYKVLNAIAGLSEASKTAQPITDLSRLNSITSAPGPLHINTLASDRKFGPAMSMKGIVKLDGNGGYMDTTRDMVFQELPSLEAFYQGYNIVKDLFKRLNFTTASSQFREILDIIPDGMQFSIYSKDKLLSSLADFFQSYLLVQSGVIKASDLKRYTTEFVQDFIAGKYTQEEKVKNNPFVQAIKPKIISKKKEAERYALNIDTTGMEQSEKDALSAGWAQLEKDAPELSHKLFVYNFFRGGIGFSPKTFMALMPIQVKESIAGYLETYTSLPDITAKSVFDQWVRNNWTNIDLVPKITDIVANDKTPTIRLSDDQAYLADRSAYIRVSNDNGDFLFRQRGGDESTVYDMVQPLGNNREYLEMYPSNVKVNPIDEAQRGVATLETQEGEFVEQHEDSSEVRQTPEEQARDLEDFYQIAYGEEREASSMKEETNEAFDEVNKDLGIQTNKDKFEDILDSFC